MTHLDRTEYRRLADKFYKRFLLEYELYKSDIGNLYMISGTTVVPFLDIDREFLIELQKLHKPIDLYTYQTPLTEELGFKDDGNSLVWEFEGHGYYSGEYLKDKKYTVPVDSYYYIETENGDHVKCSDWTKIRIGKESFIRVTDLNEGTRLYSGSIVKTVRRIDVSTFLYKDNNKYCTIGSIELV